MAYPPITELPVAPSRSDPSTFSDRADAFLAALATFQSETNAAGTYIDGVGTQVDLDATAAQTARDEAQAAAIAAAQEAVEWVSGASYTEGDVVWSGLTYLTYRAKTTHSGLTSDPSVDTTNWAGLSDDTSLADLGVTATASELNILDGATVTTAELNILDGVTATTAEINILDGVTATTAELNYNDITTLGTSQPSKVVTADANGDVKFSNAFVETVFTLTGTTPALNPNNGTIQTWTLSANSTPTDGFVAGESMTLLIDDGTAFTITWPSVTWKTNGGVAPTLNTSGFTVIVLWKVGTVLYGARVGDA